MWLNDYVGQIHSEHWVRQCLAEAAHDRLAQEAHQFNNARNAGHPTRTVFGWTLIVVGLIGLFVEYFR
jgi:hypothetical protein